jgi:hypothetical protein
VRPRDSVIEKAGGGSASFCRGKPIFGLKHAQLLPVYPFPVLPANLLIARSVGPSGALRTAIMQRPRRGEVRGLAS